MSEGLDIPGWTLLAAVAVLFIWYFWHVVTSMVSGAHSIAEIADGAVARQRAELEHEAKFGKRPLWYRAAQKIILAVLIVGSAWLIWNLVRG
jgi:hypothetical protein